MVAQKIYATVVFVLVGCVAILFAVLFYGKKNIVQENPFFDRKSWSIQCQNLPLNIVLDSVDGVPFLSGKGTDIVSCGLYKDQTIPAEKVAVEEKQQAWQEFKKVMDACANVYKLALADTTAWVDKNAQFGVQDEGVYVQKLEVLPDDKIIFHGDLHGDISSILQTLDYLEQQGYMHKNSFELLQPKDHHVYMIFLGDYVDRGAYGVETMYTVMRLKLANPNHVFLLRGNHESVEATSRYGFKKEVALKFSSAKDDCFADICSFYAYLPAAIFLGCTNNYIQCCHGGIPVGFDRKKNEATVFYNPASFIHSDFRYEYIASMNNFNGFMTSDFYVDDADLKLSKDESDAMILPGRGGHTCCTAGYNLTQEYLQDAALKSIIRAHQHSNELNSMMQGLLIFKGIYPLWLDNSVQIILLHDALDEYISVKDMKQYIADMKCGVYSMSMKSSLVRTFNVSPDSFAGIGCKFDFDTCGILTVANNYDDWIMQTIWTKNKCI